MPMQYITSQRIVLHGCVRKVMPSEFGDGGLDRSGAAASALVILRITLSVRLTSVAAKFIEALV